jgi:hypothetical protein
VFRNTGNNTDFAITRIFVLARGLTLPVILLAAWEYASRAELVDPRFPPPLEAIARTAWRETMHGALLAQLGASLARNLTGFAIGTVAGLASGMLLGLSRTADRLLGPTFHGAKQIAVLAWILLISIWFGFAETAKIVFIAVAAFARNDRIRHFRRGAIANRRSARDTAAKREWDISRGQDEGATTWVPGLRSSARGRSAVMPAPT